MSPDGESLGDPGRRVHLLHVDARHVDGHRSVLYVGQDEEQAIVRLNQKLRKRRHHSARGIAADRQATLHRRCAGDGAHVVGEPYNDFDLRRVAEQLHDAIKEVTDVSEVTIAGGRSRQVSVEIDPAKLASYNLDPLAVQRAVPGTNLRLKAGELVAGGRSTIVEAGAWIDTVERLRSTVVDARTGRPVWLRWTSPRCATATPSRCPTSSTTRRTAAPTPP